MKNKYCIYSFFFSLFLSSCDPLVTSFDDVEDAVMYQSNRIIEYPAKIRQTGDKKDHIILCHDLEY